MEKKRNIKKILNRGDTAWSSENLTQKNAKKMKKKLGNKAHKKKSVCPPCIVALSKALNDATCNHKNAVQSSTGLAGPPPGNSRLSRWILAAHDPSPPRGCPTSTPTAPNGVACHVSHTCGTHVTPTPHTFHPSHTRKPFPHFLDRAPHCQGCMGSSGGGGRGAKPSPTLAGQASCLLDLTSGGFRHPPSRLQDLPPQEDIQTGGIFFPQLGTPCVVLIPPPVQMTGLCPATREGGH